MKNIWIAAALAAACTASLAKIPPPVLDDAAKAKAAEAAAKTAWQGKIDSFLLCKAQDKVAAHYRKAAGSAASRDAKAVPVSMTPGATPAAATAKAASPAAPAATNVAANPAVAGGTAAAPAGAPTPTPCADPGPFAYNPPAQKPLEAAGAHSPPGTATSPPSTKATAAEMAPAKK